MIKGEVTDIASIAQREGKSERAVRTTLSLAFLSPEIVRGTIDGKLPRGIGVSDLTDLPLGWADQRELVETSRKIVNQASTLPRNSA
jgi:hypothetical protein